MLLRLKATITVNISFYNRCLEHSRWKPFDKILESNNCIEWSKQFFVQKFCEKSKACKYFHAIEFIERWLDRNHMEFPHMG